MAKRDLLDVIVIGAGHNGLVAAILLARSGLKVHVLERSNVIGGAVRTETPFAKAPGLRTSTGAYLLGVMPPEVMAATGVKVPTRRRDPHYLLPTTGNRYAIFGSDKDATRDQFVRFFSEADWRASEAMNAEIAAIRDDIAPAWLQEPLTVEDTAARFVRPALRDAFVALSRGSVGAYLDKFDFKSDLVKAMYAVTDGFSGVYGSWDTPGTGQNFLIHNMCRLPGSDGTWMVVEGGMGRITALFADEARRLGVTIDVDRPVERIVVEGIGESRAVAGVVAGGEELRARTVMVNADPFRTADLVGKKHLPWSFLQKIERYRRDGTTFKLNLALKGLPKFTCMGERDTPHGPTIHLLPDEKDVMRTLGEAFAEVRAGRLAPFPTIEWYIHSAVDASVKDAAGHHSSAMFVQWVPHTLSNGSSWAQERDRYAKHLLSIADRFAPGTSDLVVDMLPLAPPDIEARFGMTRGHIHHVDNSFGFADRVPYAWPVAGLYSCSSGTHPAGAVIGCGGHNAAQRALKDLGKAYKPPRDVRA